MKSVQFYRGREADTIARWVAERIPGCERGFGPCAAMAVFDDGWIIGGTVFHNYNPEAGVIEMSSAAESPRWLDRTILGRMHGYIFDEADCQLAVMRVSEKNKRMRRIGRAFGYSETVIPRLRGRDEDEAIMTMTDDAWRASKFNRG